MTKAVTRHLNYAWIEFGHSGDAQAFAAGMAGLGWKNLLLQLPRKKDAWGARYEDSANPNLPIRWKGAALLALPNSYRDVDDYPKPMIKDPAWMDVFNSGGEEAFHEKVGEICAFLSQWTFSPGLKKESATKAFLTIDGDATDWADWVITSGHGSAGSVWGGDGSLGLELGDGIAGVGPTAHNDRLKYVMVPTCYNLAAHNTELWEGLLRRTPSPNGVLGYSDSYPGGEPGRNFQKRFTELLKANGGSKPILEAWRECHGSSDIWGAVMHVENVKDTMKDWLAGKLPAPDPAGEIRHYEESNWPDGKVVTPPDHPIVAYLHVDGTRLDRTNRNDSSVGLFSGKAGVLEIEARKKDFDTTRSFKIDFYYYRPNKDGMKLDKLFAFGTPEGATVTMLKDNNKADKQTTEYDAIEVQPTTEGNRRIRVPFTVPADAHTHFHADGARAYGYYWMRIHKSMFESFSLYRDGAWLRGPA